MSNYEADFEEEEEFLEEYIDTDDAAVMGITVDGEVFWDEEEYLELE